MSKPESADAILERILKSYGLDGKLREWRAVQLWPEVVGEAIARHTRAEKVFRKKLYVVVDSPAWKQQLHFLKQDVVARINAAAGGDVVRDIQFTVGKL